MASAESNVTQAVPFFWVRDMAASVRFYVDGLGFAVTKQWVDEGQVRWCWLAIGDAGLMLQEFWKTGHHANLPDGKTGVGVSINFLCKDAVAIYREVTARGVQAKRPFVGNGMWVTQLSDPDGYQLSFQSPSDAAEETVLPDAP
jgi:lactoylglutathione lyase